jgi:hypothetical protein
VQAEWETGANRVFSVYPSQLDTPLYIRDDEEFRVRCPACLAFLLIQLCALRWWTPFADLRHPPHRNCSLAVSAGRELAWVPFHPR